jgi:PTS system mannose-specific IID component
VDGRVIPDEAVPPPPTAALSPSAAPPATAAPPPAPRLLTPGDRWSMVGRLFLLQALWNYERMQGVGFAYALAPAVRRVSKDDATAARELVPHLGYFNTHPVMASVAVGVTADQVERRARGEEAFDAAGLTRVKQALGASLAAMGDPLFWSAVRPLVGLAAVYGWKEGKSELAALVLLSGYNAIALGYRARGLFAGYARGLKYVAQLPARLERLTSFLRLVAAVLSALVIASVLVPGGGLSSHPAGLALLGVALGVIGFGVARLGPGEWGLVLGLGSLLWVTLGAGR